MGWQKHVGGRRGGRGRGRGRGRGHGPRADASRGAAGPGPRLKEIDVGIDEYVRPGPGFHGLIKSRYSDFHVSEIAPDGKIAKLTDLSHPSVTKSDKCQDEDEELNILNKYDTEILSVELWDKINAAALADKQSPLKAEVDVTGMDKDRRTKIHECVKKVFGKKVIGSTVTLNDKKFIVFSTFTNSVRVDRREKWQWNGDFVHFVLYKENCDTMEAVSQLAERLNMKHIKPAFFGYCGTKDRRGKTSQWISIRKVDPVKIVNSCKKLPHITVGNFVFKNFNLKLGDLKGNRFKIALRNVSASDDIIKDAVESLRDEGFINYYGLQRFGSKADIPTFVIGKCLLQGNYKEAVQLILKPHGPFYKNLKIYNETGSAQSAMQGLNFITHPSVEMKLLHALKKEEIGGSPNNFISALNKIPRNTRLLYIHSYQSLIWNKCVSERLKRYGFKCHAGDLVLLDPTEFAEDFVEVRDDVISDDEDSQTPKEGEIDSLQNDAKIKSDDSMQNIKNNSQLTEEKLKVKILTDEDIDKETYNISNIVMPLPGYNIEYPPNMKEFYKDLLEKDNLTLELKQKVKSYSLGGTYRYVIKKPENLLWKCIRYSDPFADLILSDLDELHNRASIKDSLDGKFKALMLEFDLPPSTYATMTLRELLKMDTSSEVQAQSNNYYLEKANQDDKSTDSSKIDTEDILSEKRKSDAKTHSEYKKFKSAE